jgi:hypothetical protein
VSVDNNSAVKPEVPRALASDQFLHLASTQLASAIKR